MAHRAFHERRHGRLTARGDLREQRDVHRRFGQRRAERLVEIEQLRAARLHQRDGAPRPLFGAHALYLLVEAAQVAGGQIRGVTQDAERTDMALELVIEGDAHCAHALEEALFERVALLA